MLCRLAVGDVWKPPDPHSKLARGGRLLMNVSMNAVRLNSTQRLEASFGKLSADTTLLIYQLGG